MTDKQVTKDDGRRTTKHHYARWQKQYNRRYQQQKHNPRWNQDSSKGIWLGRGTMTGESIVGIPGKVIKARTIRRQIMPDKYGKQLLDTINVYPWNLPTPTMAIPPQLLLPADNTASRQAIGTRADITVEDTSTQTIQETPLALPARATHHQPMDTTMATSPLATSPTTVARPPLPTPPASKRQHEEPTGEAQSQTIKDSTVLNSSKPRTRLKNNQRQR